MPAPFFNNNINSNKKIDQMIRVNHAGEYGAQKIYQGQIAFTDNNSDKQLLKTMLEHEQIHLEFFEKEIKNRNIRPTLLLGFWHYFGYIIGAISAKISIKEAMLVTSAVEEVIEQHYHNQLLVLKTMPEEKFLKENITNFMKEEVNHKNIAETYLESPSQNSTLRKKMIKNFCKLAIFLSKKI